MTDLEFWKRLAETNRQNALMWKLLYRRAAQRRDELEAELHSALLALPRFDASSTGAETGKPAPVSEE